MNTMLKGLALMQAFVATADQKKDEKGAAMTEYVVLVGLVIAGVATVLATLWPKLSAYITGLVIPITS